VKLREDVFLDEYLACGEVVLLSAVVGRFFKTEHEDLEVDLVVFDGDGVGDDEGGEALALALEDVAEEPLLLLVIGTLGGVGVAFHLQAHLFHFDYNYLPIADRISRYPGPNYHPTKT
jgi:hypothetical protein